MWYLAGLGVTDGDELLRNNRQYLDVNAIKLIETAPGTGLSQPGEEPTHHLNRNNISSP